MLFGLMDLIIICFFAWIIWKGLKKLAKFLFGCFAIVVVLSSVSTMAAEVPDWTEHHAATIEDYCPWGDAVITGYNQTIEVDCVLYDHKRQCWDTWTQPEGSTVRDYQCYPIDKYDVWTQDGRLKVDEKTDKVKVVPTGRELSEQELHSELDKIFKKAKKK